MHHWLNFHSFDKCFFSGVFEKWSWIYHLLLLRGNHLRFWLMVVLSKRGRFSFVAQRLVLLVFAFLNNWSLIFFRFLLLNWYCVLGDFFIQTFLSFILCSISRIFFWNNRKCLMLSYILSLVVLCFGCFVTFNMLFFLLNEMWLFFLNLCLALRGILLGRFHWSSSFGLNSLTSRLVLLFLLNLAEFFLNKLLIIHLCSLGFGFQVKFEFLWVYYWLCYFWDFLVLVLLLNIVFILHILLVKSLDKLAFGKLMLIKLD